MDKIKQLSEVPSPDDLIIFNTLSNDYELVLAYIQALKESSIFMGHGGNLYTWEPELGGTHIYTQTIWSLESLDSISKSLVNCSHRLGLEAHAVVCQIFDMVFCDVQGFRYEDSQNLIQMYDERLNLKLYTPEQHEELSLVDKCRFVVEQQKLKEIWNEVNITCMPLLTQIIYKMKAWTIRQSFSPAPKSKVPVIPSIQGQDVYAIIKKSTSNDKSIMVSDICKQLGDKTGEIYEDHNIRAVCNELIKLGLVAHRKRVGYISLQDWSLYTE